MTKIVVVTTCTEGPVDVEFANMVELLNLTVVVEFKNACPLTRAVDVPFKKTVVVTVLVDAELELDDLELVRACPITLVVIAVVDALIVVVVVVVVVTVLTEADEVHVTTCAVALTVLVTVLVVREGIKEPTACPVTMTVEVMVLAEAIEVEVNVCAGAVITLVITLVIVLTEVEGVEVVVVEVVMACPLTEA